MSTSVRAAEPEDLDRVLELIRGRRYAPLPVRGLSGERRREAALQVYRGTWSTLEEEEFLHAFLAERDGRCVGMLVAAAATLESITGDRQTLLHDHYVPFSGGTEGGALRSPPLGGTEGGALRTVEDRLGILRALERKAVEVARRAGDDYLVVELPPGDEDEPLFAALGYGVELNRIARGCQPLGQALQKMKGGKGGKGGSGQCGGCRRGCGRGVNVFLNMCKGF